MNLELFNTKRISYEVCKNLLGDWAHLLYEEINSPYMMKIVDFLRKERCLKIIYPKSDEVFKIYKLLSPKDIKVVIIGQEPYYNGNADGIAFSCKDNISPSLQKMFEAIPNCSYNINLERWVKQGVFLINSYLTVEKGLPLSHSKIGWDKFVEFSLKQIKNKYVAWLLMGKDANKFSKLVKKEHLLVETEHPAAASYDNREWYHKNCFNRINEYLISKGISPIDWSS